MSYNLYIDQSCNYKPKPFILIILIILRINKNIKSLKLNDLLIYEYDLNNLPLK